MQVKIKQRGQKLDNIEKIVKKTVDIKFKTTLRPCFYSYNSKQHYFKGSQPLFAKTSIYAQLIKDSKVQKLKPRS